MPDPFPQLPHPPINEVVCGFVFDPLPGIDVLDLGVYWEEVRSEYPKKQLQPPLMDNNNFLHIGPPGVRAWLISEDEERLLQLQPDRFYMNWRARGGDYPHFSDRPERDGNCLKLLALKEFDRFLRYMLPRSGQQRLDLRRVELTKIDKLVRGRHWSDFDDLCALLKVANVFGDINAVDPKQLQLRLVEAEDSDTTFVTVKLDEHDVRIEARMTMRYTSGDHAALLDKANHRLNDVFFGLLNETELERFERSPDDAA